VKAKHNCLEHRLRLCHHIHIRQRSAQTATAAPYHRLVFVRTAICVSRLKLCFKARSFCSPSSATFGSWFFDVFSQYYVGESVALLCLCTFLLKLSIRESNDISVLSLTLLLVFSLDLLRALFLVEALLLGLVVVFMMLKTLAKVRLSARG
jgi:hypothetical protein